FFFFQAEDGIRDLIVTGVQTCALPIWIGKGERAFATAEQLGMRLCDKRPRYRFDHAAGGERALGAAGAKLDRAEDRLARRHTAKIGRASCRERGEIWGVGG